MQKEKFLIYGSPGRYIQGKGMMKYIGDYVSFLGKRACILVDKSLPNNLLEKIREGLNKTNVEYSTHKFDGIVTVSRIDDFSRRIKNEGGCEVVIGVGGGKTLDAAKMVAHRLKARRIMVPTIASTDAPTSSLAVVDKEGGKTFAEFYKWNPDFVLVDTEIIVNAPVRFFLAGIGDAVSKKYEIQTAISAGMKNVFGGKQVFFISDLAHICYQTLLRFGLEARYSVERKEITEAVEQIITSTILLSGIAFENGGLLGAHDISAVLYEKRYGDGWLHGELVALGTLCQIILEKYPQKEFLTTYAFLKSLNLPCKLSDIGISADNQELINSIAHELTLRFHKAKFNVTQKAIFHTFQLLEKI